MANLKSKVQSAAPPPADLIAAVAGFAELSASGGPGGKALSGTSYLDLYLNNLERLSELTGELGYAGLQGACLTVRDNVDVLRGRDGGLAAPVRDSLDTWLELVRWYLELPPEAGAIEALLYHLRLPVWDVPLDPDDAEVLQVLLMEQRRKTTAGEEHQE